MNEYEIRQREDEEEIEIDLGVLLCDLWKGFKKFWWIFLILCSLLAGMNLTRSILRYRPMYQSQVTFTVSTQSNYDETNTTYAFYYNQSTAEQLEKLFPYILQSDVMQARIKEELGAEAINGSISAEAVPNSNLFTMTVTGSNGKEAKDILEATIKSLPDVTKYVIGETKLNIIQPATTPKTAYNKPNYRREAAKGLAVGMIISVMMLTLYAVFRKTIRKVDDFQSVLNMKCLGVMPQVHFKAHKKSINQDVSIINAKTGRPFRESVKSLSLKLDRQMKEKNQKVILVTSTLPEEGKSTVALNLAMTFAEQGKNVLLIDMDLRNPTQAKNLGIDENAVGLEYVLRGNAAPEEAIQQTEQGIYFLGAQRACPKVSALLTRAALTKLVRKYRPQMDYIILDTPPCGAISDAVTISDVCDGILYVIRQDVAKQGQILDGIQQITSHGAQLLGGILNGVENSLSGYGYHYYGKYGYGYGGYGYGKYGGYGYGKRKDGKKSKKDEEK